MTEFWKDVYVYHGPSLGSEKISILESMIPTMIFFVLSVYTFFLCYKNFKKNNYKTSTLLFFSIVLFGYFLFNLIEQVGYLRKRNQLSVAVATGNCTTFEGKLTNIYPETGDGHMAFEISGHLFRYDNHHFALNKQLCSSDGPELCLGDFSRLCLHDESDGEILKIEKKVAG